MKAKIEEKLAAVGVVGPGRDWVIKALDPATAGVAPGIPDTSSTQVLRPEFNYRCTIQAPATSSTWDAYLFFPPGDQNVVVWAAAPSSSGPVNFGLSVPNTPTGATFGTCKLQPYTDLPGYTNFDEPASVDYSIGAPFQSSGSIRAPAGLASSLRSQYRSHTIELSAAGLSDQGEVYAGQFPISIRSSRLQNCGSIPSSSSGYTIAVVADYVALPLNEADLTLSCRNAYVGKAKDGVYMPIRLAGPAQPFSKSETPTGGTWTGPAFSSGQRMAFITAAGATVQWPRMLLACQNDTSGETATALTNVMQTDTWVNLGYQEVASGDTGYDNCMVGVVIFRGLSGTGGGGGGGPAFSASLIIKSLIGLEVVPRPTSLDRVFQKPAAMYNPRALEAYYLLANELAPAFPASANALGGLLPILASAASTLWPTVRAGLIGLRTGVADAMSPYASAPRDIVVRERVALPKPAGRSSSVRSTRSRASVSIKVPRRAKQKRRAKA